LVGASASYAGLFEVTSLTGGGATGTSNGVPWSLSPTVILTARTVLDNSWQGFTGANFSVPLPNADKLHFGSDPFTFTLERAIRSVLIYVSDNDATPDAFFDFGVTPTVLSGSVRVEGTRFGAGNITGGLVRLDNLYTRTLVHPGNIVDGNDFAMVVTPIPPDSDLVARPVEVTVQFVDWVGPRTPPLVEVRALRAGTSVTIGNAEAVPVNNQVGFDIVTTIRPLDFRVTAAGFLAHRVKNVMAPDGKYRLTAELRAGDVDGDGSVTVFDYDLLSRFFDFSSDSPGWMTHGADGFAPIDADLDGDNTVSVFDFDLLSRHFDQNSDN